VPFQTAISNLSFHENCYSTLREEYRVRAWVCRMLRRIFEPKTEEILKGRTLRREF
jgi:hypothetical protein